MPGFLINHAGRGYSTEALRVAGKASPRSRSSTCIMREQVRFSGRRVPARAVRAARPDRPRRLAGGDGIDLSSSSIDEPRFTPSAIGAQRRAAGLFGRKNGQGFYDYPARRHRAAGAGNGRRGRNAQPEPRRSPHRSASVAPVPVHLSASADHAPACSRWSNGSGAGASNRPTTSARRLRADRAARRRCQRPTPCAARPAGRTHGGNRYAVRPGGHRLPCAAA